MNTKILTSLILIGLAVSGVAFGTYAYFSDTETSTGNTFTTGTIDIKIDGQNPWTDKFYLSDMKPSEVGYITFNIQNVGTNPVNVRKHLTVTGTSGGIHPESELVEDPSDTINNIHEWILYDLSVKVPIADNPKGWYQTIYDEDVTIANINSQHIFLGMIPVGGHMIVTQSYHMKADTTNWAQGDKMTFDIEIIGEQLQGSVKLDNKVENENWRVVWEDDKYGVLTYNMMGPTFDYSFTGKAPKASTYYCLIYYADPWPGDGALIGCAMSDGSGGITMSGSTELNMDLPDWNTCQDQNHPEGAKIWLVTSSDYNSNSQTTGPMTAWNPGDYLFETGLITYDDTQVP
jgi:predicted ribosomally synthesized peptide with SipW-like signal peptide